MARPRRPGAPARRWRQAEDRRPLGMYPLLPFTVPAPLARLVILLVVLLVGLVGGAARGAEPIRLWHAYRGGEEAALAEVLVGFDEAPVETLAIPYDAFGSKLATAIPLGDGPHLFIDSHERLGDYRRRKIIAPVGDALEAGVFDAVALQAVQQGGEAWAVPLSRKSVALYVNTALAGEVPPTLEGILALAPTLPPGVYPYAYEVKKAYSHAPILHAFGGRMLDDDDGFGFVGPEAEASLRYVKSLVDAGLVPGNADGNCGCCIWNS